MGKHVMLDLETMGNGPDAAIVAIGAVQFDLQTGELGGQFYQVIDLESAINFGGVVDASTVMWWLKQSNDARAALMVDGKMGIDQALDEFAEWYPKGASVWGNGANFDPVILERAFRRLRMEPPWPYWGVRCFRTMKAAFPGVKATKTGVAHNALDDSISQALHLCAIWAKYGNGGG